MRMFQKLIRDNMPEILAKEGRKIETRVLENEEEYVEWLRRKCVEEIQEMPEQPDSKQFLIERLAYLDELLTLICEVKGISKEEIKSAQQKIIAERGSFRKRLLLEP